MYAVVSSGGKQYRVEPGSTLIVERLTADAGATITFDRVLLVGDGETISVGTPTVSGASVSGTVIGEELGPKIVIFKYKQKVKYRRRTGHRQHHTRVRIDGITANGRTESAPEEEKKAAKAKAPKAAKAKAAKAGKGGGETRERGAIQREEEGRAEAARIGLHEGVRSEVEAEGGY